MRTMERLPVACLCLLLSCSAVVRNLPSSCCAQLHRSKKTVDDGDQELMSETPSGRLICSVDKIHSGSAGSRVVVFEDSDVILPCSLSTKEDITLKLFVWKKDGQKYVFFSNAGSTAPDNQFKGRVSPFPDELQHGNASIIIRKTKVPDSGNYTCDFPRLQPPQTFPIELVVAAILKDRSAENLPGVAAKPSVKTLHQTNDWSLLQCEVKGASPKPKVEWRNSSGNILPAEEPLVTERGNYSDIIVNITVTKTDTYYCVATQKEIYHEAEADTYVHISGSSYGWPVAGFVIILLIVVAVLLAVLYRKGCITLKSNSGKDNL